MKDERDAFTPPHCPNRRCRFHRPLGIHWRFKKAGFFSRKQYPWRVQRYQCLTCRRYFSTQTFLITYWLKRPDVVSTLLTKAVGCMANRQIARDLGTAPKTVDDQLSRLGRHCMLYHWQHVNGTPPPRTVVIDGFETFEHSQYYPFHFNLCVEKGTDFLLSFTDSELRRKGRMTPAQKQRRRELECVHGRPDPGAVCLEMESLLRSISVNAPRLTVHSDDHPAYPRAIRALTCSVDHHITPGKEHRGVSNPLFEVNLVDLLIRHSQAGHKRETIAFAKRRAGSAERLSVFLVWRNYIKRRREKKRRSPTPAMARGIVTKPLTPDDVAEKRLFFDHIPMPDGWKRYYRRLIRTRVLARHRVHRLKYAF